MPSTVIRDFRYLPQKRQLEVTFNTGRRYRYLDVPDTVYAQMRSSFSKGAYFNAFVRHQFAFMRLENS